MDIRIPDTHTVIEAEHSVKPNSVDFQSLAFGSKVLRSKLGQYATPVRVCDWMLALLAPGPMDRMLDVGCGEGAFLRRAYHRYQALYPSAPQDALSRLCGVDYHAASVQATIEHLATDSGLNPAQVRDAALIYCANFLDADFQQIILSKLDRQQSKRDHLLNGSALFDCIIGNPPYVRQESLRQDSTLAWDENRDSLRSAYVDYLNHYPEQATLWGRKLDSTMAFFMQSQRLLKPSGRLVFVTGNSWLNSTIGERFRRFLHHFFEIELLAESACERWFPDAAINAIIISLKKRTHWLRATDTEIAIDQPTRTVRLLQPLRECSPDIDSSDYWQQLALQTNEIRAGEWLPEKKTTALTLNVLPATSLPVSLLSDPLNLNSTNEPQGVQAESHSKSQEDIDSKASRPLLIRNWALALRAPSDLWHWLEQDALWQPLDCWGTIRHPLKTGINQFFHLTRQQAEKYGIEAEFLQPVIRSARRVQSWILENNDAPKPDDDFLFVCHQTTDQLNARGKIGALGYIAWGESQVAPPRQKRMHPTPWPNVVSVRNNRPWYAIRPLPPSDLLCNRFLDSRFFFPLCQKRWIEDQTFYGLTFHPDFNERLPGHPTLPEAQSFAAALLNSTLSFTLLEFILRGSLGDGVLQATCGDMAAFPVPNPALYSATELIALGEAFQVMAQRPIFPLEKELQQADRLALDTLVLAPITARLPGHPSASDYRDLLVSVLLERFHERHQLARAKVRP